MEITLQQTPNKQFHFQSTNGEKTVELCASPQLESGNSGFRPMELLLISLAGCLSIDVLQILYKQRQTVANYQVKVKGERGDTVPSVFTDITVELYINGEVDEKKLQRAIRLSEEKYCSVHHMLSPPATIQVVYFLNENEPEQN